MSQKSTSRFTGAVGLGAGHTRCNLPDGHQLDPSIRRPFPASPSPSPASARGLPTTATSGPTGSVSSASAALQLSWESRLRARLTGSPECEVIWKEWVTPWGQCLSKPRAVVRRSIGIAIGLWPSTLSAPQTEASHNQFLGRYRKALTQAGLALWPTSTSNAKPTPSYNEAGNSAGQVAQRKLLLGLWPANQAKDHKSGAVSPSTLHSNSRPVNEVALAVWSALRSTDGDKADGAKGGPNMTFGAGGSPLPSQVAQTAQSNSSSAPTTSGGGSLHPEFTGWEMGYNILWLMCAPMQSMTVGRRS
jgi:hypothetical protein